MMNRDYAAVLACVGAVIGAGFASGREIVVFFSQYGNHAWWLIALSALTMAALCALCMHCAAAGETESNWCCMLPNHCFPRICSLMLMVMTSGAMISAAGHVVALLWYHRWAYIIGAMGTLILSWWSGYGSLKPLSLLSAVLSLALLCALMSALVKTPVEKIVLDQTFAFSELLGAALRSVGYAGMNMMLAMGVVCRCSAQAIKRNAASALFGWVIAVLMMISHCVYSGHPESADSAFPMIVLLSKYGRTGYLFGALVLYLAIFTTLTSVLYALRTAVETRIQRRNVVMLTAAGIPLAVSGLGFSQIVEHLYAPAGWFCLVLVFLPLVLLQWKKGKKTSFP